MAIVTPVEAAPGQRRRLSLASPATGETIDEIEVQSEADVRAAVEQARKVQPAWAALSFQERAHYLRRALSILMERQEEFIDVIVRESGKPRSEALMMDIFSGCDSLAFYAKNAAKMLRPQRKSLHGIMRLMKKLQIVYRPLGVVGVISPWNGPFILSVNPAAQALVAGNAVILKPSEVTPRSGQLVARLFEAAGLPEGVLQVLTGDGETGAALIESGVDKISFTGSVATGRRVAEACARQLLPCTLELGGKDPMLVCADANLDVAAGGAVAGAFMNTGQYCCGTERVYVMDQIADAFIEKVVERVGKLRQARDGEFDVGAIFWQKQLDVIEAHMADAIEKGARVLVGGQRNPELCSGLYYEPTVLVDVSHEMRIMKEETFGPILPIMRVRDTEHAIALANDTDYGLGANIWSTDTNSAFDIALRIDSGSVCINDMTMTYGAHEAPFGGRKTSGVGQVNGEVGLRGYCHAKPILTDRFGGKQTAGHYPYSAKRDAGMQRFIKLLWGRAARK
ncbi:MAG: aldehyde dehydrogenase family protein [bacterium]|nr:aldehyde dehydrogenase family protein [bacterium]